MTDFERTQLQKDVLFNFHMAGQEAMYHRQKLALMGESLERLGVALQRHPELITTLPEPNAIDYRNELNALPERQALLDGCKEMRVLEDKVKQTGMRKAALNL
ncbi:MAG: hypothetical protein V4555_08245 [Acidobacteriota bacterium]